MAKSCNIPMTTKTNSAKSNRTKGTGKTAAVSANAVNGRILRASLGKSAKPKLTNARLRKLAVKHRPPQSWYDEQQNLY